MHEGKIPEQRKIETGVSVEDFSFFDSPTWGDVVTEELTHGDTKESTYGSTTVMFNGAPIDCHVGIVTKKRNGENHETVLSIVLGEIKKSEIILCMTIRHPQYGSRYHGIEISIKKNRDKIDTLPKNVGLALYKNTVKNMEELVQRMNLHPAIHTIIRSIDHGDTSITQEKWYSWFGPIIEEFGYTPHPTDEGLWEKRFD